MNLGNKHYYNNVFGLDKVQNYLDDNQSEKPNTDFNFGEEDDEEDLAQRDHYDQ